MKDFIVLCAVAILLIVFPLQNALELSNEVRINKFSEIVYVSTQKARIDGCFKPENIAKLKADLFAAFPDLKESDIYIDVTTTPKYRKNYFDERELIYYDIRIPVRKIIAVPGLFGITPDQNRYFSVRKGFVLSEVLASF